ncbi:MAG: aminoacyl-tRNA hydrolase [Pleopsidium flavum]|nr:MAG: aminoacyl-tRNA hydrolase [Pleopsidium flavum]
MPPPPPRPLLIASLGNPPPYTHTLHSAGHTVLSSLASHLSLPPFTRSRLLSNGLVTPPFPPLGSTKTTTSTPPYTLYQSPTQMNISGPTLAKTWHAYLRSLASLSMSMSGEEGSSSSSSSSSSRARLIVVHDELEESLGRVRVRRGGASARGHRGVRSCVESLRGGGVVQRGGAEGQNKIKGGGGGGFIRIGIGIGRCQSREREDVARFVLRGMEGWERERVEKAAKEVARLLEGFAGGGGGGGLR